MSDSQAYAGFGSRESGADETNRLDFVVRSILNKTATMTLVQVKAVNGQAVDILPLVAQIDGAGNAVQHAIIHNAPVFRLQGSKSAIIVDPVIGDMGLAIFAHNDISSAKKNKGAALPGSRRKFDWSDAIYLGGVLNGEPTSWVKFLATGEIDITASGGMIRIDSGSDQIRLVSSSMVSTSGVFAAGNGKTGTAIDKNGKTLTFTNGILTGLSS